MRCNAVEADGGDVVDRSTEANRAGDIWCSRFKLIRQLVVERLFKSDRADHVAATLVGGHGLQQLPLSVKHADTGRTIQLVTGKGIKITVKRLHIYRNVRSRLCAISIILRTGLIVPSALET